jgi:hypothetical protein
LTAIPTSGAPISFKWLDDFVGVTQQQIPDAQFDAPAIFVGHGIVAPEYQWDDYKGVDLKGKVLLMLNNDPADDPAIFAGKTRLYYGRWDYKYEMAAKAGAAGAIIVHTEASAGYGWQVVQSGWIGEQFAVPYQGGPQTQMKAWATEAASGRIARLGGQDLAALVAAAQKRDFKPVPLGVTLDLTLPNTVTRKKTANVIGRLPGRDPVVAKEALLLSAHHDHLGMRDGAGDTIYNGAHDNASGVASMLAVAESLRSLKEPPRRSVYFAAVAGEEQGLLGSAYLANNLPLPAGRVAANVNIDGLNIWGKARDAATEAFFFGTYGSPIVQAMVGLRTDDASVSRRIGWSVLGPIGFGPAGGTNEGSSTITSHHVEREDRGRQGQRQPAEDDGQHHGDDPPQATLLGQRTQHAPQAETTVGQGEHEEEPVQDAPRP